MDYDYDVDGDYYPDFYSDNEVLDDGEESPWDTAEHAPWMTASQMLKDCVVPTISDGASHMGHVLVWCLVYRLTTQIVQVPKAFAHLVSTGCGVAVLHHFFGDATWYLAVQGAAAYASLLVGGRRRGWLCTAVCVTFLLVCELAVVEPVRWHTIRAAQMLVAMRAISVGFQVDEKSLEELPGLIAFTGYLYHVGTVAFGPWISFKHYMNIENNRRSHLKWAWHIVRSALLSLIFLSVSACWTIWLIPAGTYRWLLAYRDALSFRTSHYFVSFLSEATALASGVDTSAGGDWSVTVSRPWHVEVPRSLVEVVINWNVPMHTWLRTYVFRVARPWGAAAAIGATYGVSALLHGLNFQLGAVLLSLGFYTYVEHGTRHKLAAAFNASIAARRCPDADCSYRYKASHWLVRLANVALSLLTVFHLAYLGVMFDSSKSQEHGYSYWHVLAKWRSLDFASHWVILATFVFYVMI